MTYYFLSLARLSQNYLECYQQSLTLVASDSRDYAKLGENSECPINSLITSSTMTLSFLKPLFFSETWNSRIAEQSVAPRSLASSKVDTIPDPAFPNQAFSQAFAQLRWSTQWPACNTIALGGNSWVNFEWCQCWQRNVNPCKHSWAQWDGQLNNERRCKEVSTDVPAEVRTTPCRRLDAEAV
ncbi:hypothetical protein B0H13DRAFT_1851912 [Mycena leptocephala]|nr:hypothetical protein B0H13DRAFT_1851912 [Mycena leptocephala]